MNSRAARTAFDVSKSQTQYFSYTFGTRLTLAYNPDSRHPQPKEQRVCPAIAVPPRNVTKRRAPATNRLLMPFDRHGEHEMLSPHEFATLLLVQEAPNQVDMEREELDALLERQLVQLENLASGRQQWRLTPSGDSTIKAFKRFS
jgi:hypothetical protein